MQTIIQRTRQMTADADPNNPFFDDQFIQDRLDDARDDIRMEELQIAPSFVNAASTNNQAQTIFADFYSSYSWWEGDVVLQGIRNGQPWVVLTPLNSELVTGHFAFELDVFNTGTAPGQMGPVFATGKVYDIYAAAADLLEFWAASLTSKIDITTGGQGFKLSQWGEAKLKLANRYRMRSKPKVAKMVRPDIRPDASNFSESVRDSIR